MHVFDVVFFFVFGFSLFEHGVDAFSFFAHDFSFCDVEGVGAEEAGDFFF